MVEIRGFRRDDLDDLYRICLATAGAAAYRDPRLVGHVYAAPYAALSPRSVFVAEDAHGVGGYILGALDTRNFESQLKPSGGRASGRSTVIRPTRRAPGGVQTS